MKAPLSSMVSRPSLRSLPKASQEINLTEKAVQQRIQVRYNTSFEVIISESDFVVNTYYSGPRQCKFETERYFVAVYQTPVQHDIFDVDNELALASVDKDDPLGWKQGLLEQRDEVIEEGDSFHQEEGIQYLPRKPSHIIDHYGDYDVGHFILEIDNKQVDKSVEICKELWSIER
ncbi:hypothetical protein KIN20_019115 [Parelaphostrongylus tenuis]|uniref:Ground-like domain-containing protein n=1 Tax=Parelaphostrongylus tenuis TaxID=148309 RepID=A0AAD5N897_PARTN|nr:hypothetical protein KIN20_019115 [Parelaphostrongylus tenuis]